MANMSLETYYLRMESKTTGEASYELAYDASPLRMKGWAEFDFFSHCVRQDISLWVVSEGRTGLSIFGEAIWFTSSEEARRRASRLLRDHGKDYVQGKIQEGLRLYGTSPRYAQMALEDAGPLLWRRHHVSGGGEAGARLDWV